MDKHVKSPIGTKHPDPRREPIKPDPKYIKGIATPDMKK